MILFIITSLNKQEKDVFQNKINIYELINHKKEKIYAHSLFSHIHIIHPELNTESAVGKFYWAKAYQNYLLINNLGQELLVYDFNGNFIFKTRRGKGPNEIMHLDDFTIDPNSNEIFVLDGVRKQIIGYDFQGNVKNIIKQNLRATSIAYIGRNEFCFHVPYNYYSHNGKHFDYFFISDAKGVTHDSMLINRGISSTPYVTRINFISDNGSVFFHPIDCDTIFTITNSQFVGAYIFDYGKFKLPSKYYKSTKEYQKFASDYLQISQILPTSKYIFINYAYKHSKEFALFDVKMNTFKVSDLKDTEGKNGIMFGTENNFFYLKPRGIYKKNSIIMSGDPADIINYVNNFTNDGKALYNTSIDFLKRIEIEDNPIFFIGELSEI